MLRLIKNKGIQVLQRKIREGGNKFKNVFLIKKEKQCGFYFTWFSFLGVEVGLAFGCLNVV